MSLISEGAVLKTSRSPILVAVAFAALSGCADLPRDPERTTELIRENGTIRVGMVAGVPPDAASEKQMAAAARHLRARVSRSEGPGELLLAQLERGELDLVYGSFAANSPWKHNVYFGEPPSWRSDPPKDFEAPRFAYRLGENGWIMTMEQLKP